MGRLSYPTKKGTYVSLSSAQVESSVSGLFNKDAHSRPNATPKCSISIKWYKIIEVPESTVCQNVILPLLEMNRSCFEVQCQAVKRADHSVRSQLLGRVLHVVRYNPELVYLFLAENVPAFVRTGEEEDGDRVEEYFAPLEQDRVLVSVAGHKRKALS